MRLSKVLLVAVVTLVSVSSAISTAATTDSKISRVAWTDNSLLIPPNAEGKTEKRNLRSNVDDEDSTDVGEERGVNVLKPFQYAQKKWQERKGQKELEKIVLNMLVKDGETPASARLSLDLTKGVDKKALSKFERHYDKTTRSSAWQRLQELLKKKPRVES